MKMTPEMIHAALEDLTAVAEEAVEASRDFPTDLSSRSYNEAYFDTFKRLSKMVDMAEAALSATPSSGNTDGDNDG
jgi:hypothetical protein